MKRRQSILSCFLAVMLLLTACMEQEAKNPIDASVLAAWEGAYSKDNRAKAIDEYDKFYIPALATNVDGSTVSFEIDFNGESVGKVMLAPVDDGNQNAESDIIVDFTTDATLDGSMVYVDIGWWETAPAAMKTYSLWSYLLWVKDADGVSHYYYFRVNYDA